MYIQWFQPVSNNSRTESRITSDRREDKCIRRRYQSLHESIDSVPDDRSTVRHSVYNKHQTCTAVCRQVVHESKCIIICDIQFMHALCKKFHHNWQVYIGVQNERNKVFFSSMEHIWNRLDKTLPSAYNWRLCLIISASSVMSLVITWPRHLTLATSPMAIPLTANEGLGTCNVARFLHIKTLLFLELYIIACSLLYFSQASNNSMYHALLRYEILALDASSKVCVMSPTDVNITEKKRNRADFGWTLRKTWFTNL